MSPRAASPCRSARGCRRYRRRPQHDEAAPEQHTHEHEYVDVERVDTALVALTQGARDSGDTTHAVNQANRGLPRSRWAERP